MEGRFAVPELRTNRLILRAPEERDIPAWFERATDQEAAALAGDTVPASIAEGKAWLARSQQRARAGERLQWVIDWPGHAESVGTVALALKIPEISFVIGRDFWGQGVAGESARCVLAYGFDQLEMTKIQAELVADNLASKRLLDACGFRLVDRFIDDSDGAQCLKMRLLAADRLF